MYQFTTILLIVNKVILIRNKPW